VITIAAALWIMAMLLDCGQLTAAGGALHHQKKSKYERSY
jgi:hypothetical protein